MKSISLYMGLANMTMSNFVIPILAIAILLLIIISFCLTTLKRFNDISAIDALRSGLIGETISNKKIFFFK